MNSFSKLLIDESPLTVLPSLVSVLGLERAILLQQIQYLLRQKQSGKILDDGEKYIWNTAEEFQKNWFPFWQPDTIRKHLKILEDKGFLISKKPFAKQRNHTKFYRIDYVKLDERLNELLPEEAPAETGKVNDLDAASDSESNRKIVGIEPEDSAASDSEYNAGSLKETKTSTKTSGGGGTPAGATQIANGSGKPPATDAASHSPPESPGESHDDYIIRKQIEFPHLDVPKIFRDFKSKCGSAKYPKLKLNRPAFDRWLETEYPPIDAAAGEERETGAFDEEAYFKRKYGDKLKNAA